MPASDSFAFAKLNCLGKRDKSSAGRIDARAVDICSILNERDEFYTTSSCSGRCFLYWGEGIKSTATFRRCRISHDLIGDAQRYFNLDTLDDDPTGGADPIRTISQFDHAKKAAAMREEDKDEQAQDADKGTSEQAEDAENDTLETQRLPAQSTAESSGAPIIWLRMEPFILHVACRSLEAAQHLMAAARPSLKNVGLTTWTAGEKYLVAIWGDESLELPVTTPACPGANLYKGQEEWLQTLVNERLERNWNKIQRFVDAVREWPTTTPIDNFSEMRAAAQINHFDPDCESKSLARSFDVVGDVAIVYHDLPPTEMERVQLADAIIKQNKKIKVVVARVAPLQGEDRSVSLVQLAGHTRKPLVTTHTEFSIRCTIDLDHCFFSPRMAQERLRICQQVARGEHVLVLFCGVAMDALQIAGRTEATSIVAVEQNEIAVQCARYGRKLLERNKAVKCVGAADRLEIVHSDVLEYLPTLPRNHYDRILAPRPKDPTKEDGDLGSGDGGIEFLKALMPVLKQDGGECHWYDFCADHEFPACDRTRTLIEKVAGEQNLAVQVIHVANAGSIAKRQLRVCMDFRLMGAKK